MSKPVEFADIYILKDKLEIFSMYVKCRCQSWQMDELQSFFDVFGFQGKQTTAAREDEKQALVKHISDAYMRVSGFQKAPSAALLSRI